MELAGTSWIAAPRNRVWDALNDPDLLARCIEGVERLERVGDNRFEGLMNARVGPVRARFTGHVELTDLDPPARYTILGEGAGGAAGFARGKAEVALAEAAEDGVAGTRLDYTVHSTVGGKLAQLGSRLIEGTVRSYADRFFARLKEELESPAPAVSAEEGAEQAGVGETAAVAPMAEVQPGLVPPATPITPVVEPTPGRGLAPGLWAGLLVLLVVVLLAALLL